MKPLRCLLGWHDWKITPAVYADWVNEMLAKAEQEATRTCRVCGVTQSEDRQCLGLNPPRYRSHWHTASPPRKSAPNRAI